MIDEIVAEANESRSRAADIIANRPQRRTPRYTRPDEERNGNNIIT